MRYLKKYEYAIAVLEHGGISQAADHLGISQPTFSKYLKSIEAELGAELFDRSSLPIKPTKVGICFIEAGKRFIDLDRQLQKQLEEIKNETHSLVRVGISPSRSPYMMPKIVALFKQRCPDARIVIEERTTDELTKRLIDGELDLIISILDEGSHAFECKELFDEELLLASPSSFLQEIPSQILASSPLISIGHGQKIWLVLKEILAELKIGEPMIECQSIESALSLVKQGVGSTIVPSYIARESVQGVRFTPLNGENAKKYKRKICLFYRKEQFLTQAERIFIDCVTKIEEKRS